MVYSKKVTGFSNSEEVAVALTDIVPFLVENMLQTNAGLYSKGDDWAVYLTHGGHLITGQNPASSAPAAEALLKALA